MDPATAEYANALRDFLENTVVVLREMQTVEILKGEGTLSVNRRKQNQLVKFPVNVAKDGQVKLVPVLLKPTSVKIHSQRKYAMERENAIATNVNVIEKKDNFVKSQRV